MQIIENLIIFIFLKLDIFTSSFKYYLIKTCSYNSTVSLPAPPPHFLEGVGLNEISIQHLTCASPSGKKR